MIKSIAVFVSLILISCSSSATTVTAVHDFTYSEVIGSTNAINLDFGVTGRELENVSIALSFSGNLWDSDENFGFEFQVRSPGSPDESLNYVRTITNNTGSSINSLNTTLDQHFFEHPDFDFLNISDMYINSDGLASFKLFEHGPVGSDGVYISNMVVTADLVAVPLPGAFALFLSGIVLLFARRKKLTR